MTRVQVAALMLATSMLPPTVADAAITAAAAGTTVHVCLAENTSAAKVDLSNGAPGTPQDTYASPEDNCKTFLYADEGGADRHSPLAKVDDVLVLRVTQGGVAQSFSSAGITSFAVGEKTFSITAATVNRQTIFLRVGTYVATRPHGTVIPVSVTPAGGAVVYNQKSFFRYSDPWTFYGAAGSENGFWFPVGMFGTSHSSAGIRFAPMPIGVAWGGRWNRSPTSYLGFSVFGSWLITDENGTDSRPTGAFVLSNATGGLLLDINNYLYLGAAYAYDFGSYSGLGGHLAVGLGPAMLEFFKSEGVSR